MNYKHGHAIGYKASPTLKSWQHMISRCLNPNDPKYPRYGARGICVCERWIDFQSFLADMGRRPKGLTLGRIDNNGNYEPNNCQWETPVEQQNNREYCHQIEYKGKFYTVAELATELGVSYHFLYNRVRRGYSNEDIAHLGHYKPGPKVV